MEPNPDIDFKGKPVYVQIAERLMESLRDAGADTRVPSVREYAATMEVNINTVMRSYELLERRGMVYNRRGVGFFVSPDASSRIAGYFSEEFFDKELPRFFARMKKLGVSPDKLQSLYQNYLDKQ